MTTEPVKVEAVMAATGLTKRQVFRLVRQGRIPASIVAGKFIMFPPQFDQLMHDGIGPEPEPEPEPTPIDNPLAPERFFKTRKAS